MSEALSIASSVELSIAPAYPGFLDDLGFAGLGELELPILAALASGDPLLLVGRHGAAKSAVARAIATALGLSYYAYDASKAMFEDVVGFPDPASLATGRVRYVPTPQSMWDKEFILIDELSRASPSMQNKWLEVVRARTVMGMPLERLKCVFSAMNPTGYAGAMPVDEALAGRFPWIVEVPEISGMDAASIERVIRAASPDDAPLLGAFQTTRPRGASGLAMLIERVRVCVPRAIEQHDRAVVAWVRAIERCLYESASPLDGRRAAMLRRNALVALAVYDAANLPVDDLGLLLGRVLRVSLPYAATGVQVERSVIEAAHATALIDVFEPDRRPDVLDARDLPDLVERYLERAPGLAEEDHDRVLVRVLNRRTEGPPRERALAMVVGLLLAKGVAAAPERFPSEVVARVMSWYARRTGVLEGFLVDMRYQQLLREVAGATGPDALAWRIAASTAERAHYGPVSIEDTVKALLPRVAALFGEDK